MSIYLCVCVCVSPSRRMYRGTKSSPYTPTLLLARRLARSQQVPLLDTATDTHTLQNFFNLSCTDSTTTKLLTTTAPLFTKSLLPPFGCYQLHSDNANQHHIRSSHSCIKECGNASEPTDLAQGKSGLHNAAPLEWCPDLHVTASFCYPFCPQNPPLTLALFDASST